MKFLTKKSAGVLAVAAAAVLTFTLVVFFCTASPGSAQTAWADTGAVSSPLPADSVAFLEGMQKAFRDISAQVLPSVVTLDVIETRRVSTNRMEGFPWFFFRNPENDSERQNEEREYQTEGLGSGVIVRKTGKTYYVLTNQHVVGSAKEISVKLHDERRFTGTLVGADERKDIALVSFESDDASIPVARLGNSDGMQTGDIVFAVGAPLGYMSSVTQGIVSAVGRSGGPGGNINDFIQTDAAINRGNSGGPLINIYGEVIGINTWIASSTGGSQGLGFSIPVNNVRRAIDEFITGGRIRYGWLGVSLMEPSREIRTELSLGERRGALASQVFLGSPADKAGIQPGDFVIALNQRDVRAVDQLVREVGELPAGSTAVFRILRGGRTIDLTARIEERSETVVADSSKLWPGFIPMPLTDNIRTQLKLEAGQKGIVVTNVQGKSAAGVMGLKSGDVITKVNDREVATLSDFYVRLADRSLNETWFDVIREGQPLSTMRYKR